ncbi:LIC_13387 family protein [Kineococcus sp. SYSU DK006]|uniref:LIC_13387 family protein n=1 Tax=Kineococcus sp. SYSU DK006 TaxID=3383127 RepID=UPI003D7E4CAA
MTRPRPRPATSRSRATTVAGWSLVATGALHASLVAAGAIAQPPPGERAVRASMRAATTSVAGLERSFWQLFNGFSLAMALLLVGFGALNLLVVRHAPHLLHRTRALLWLDACVVLPLLVVSLLLFPPPPVLLLGLAAAAVGTALCRPDDRSAALPPASPAGP